MAQSFRLCVLSRGVYDHIKIVYILGFVIMYFFASQCLGQRCLSRFTATDESRIALVEASTSDTVPVMIRLPLNLSTKPSSIPDDFIAISAMMIAVSAGLTVMIPMAALE